MSLNFINRRVAQRSRKVLRQFIPNQTTLWAVVLLAAIYFGVAKISLLFASLRGGVTPVWLASGLALAAILLLGYGVWHGIFFNNTAIMNTSTNRNPVLLVHGIIRTSSVFRTMLPYLTGQGWSVYTVDLTPNNATRGLDEMAAQLAGYIDELFAPEQPFDLVGLSMGGLVTRYYVQRLGGIERVQRYITISAPHKGTWLAYLWHRYACVQMRPGSAFLNDLNQDSQMLERINFTSIWTPWDVIIIPAENSQMPVGRDVKLSTVLAHGCMVAHPHSWEAVAAALSQPIKCDHPADALVS